MTPDTARLFLGLELSGEARNALDSVRRELQSAGSIGKFHSASLYHLTLVFLGNTPVSLIPSIERIMNRVPAAPFDLTLSSLGTFKNGSILWAGVRECPALMEYQKSLADALRKAGFPLEETGYSPHITLARQVKTAVPAIEVPRITFPVRHATLFESTRVEGRLAYLPLYRSVFP